MYNVSPPSCAIISLHVEPPDLGGVQFPHVHTQIDRVHLNVMGLSQSLKKKTHTHQSIESTDKWDKIINDWTSLDSIWILVLKKGKKITGFEFHFVFIVFVKFEQQNNSFIHVLQKIM